MGVGLTVSDHVVLPATDVSKLAADLLYEAKATDRDRREIQVRSELGSMDHENGSKVLVLANTGLEALEYICRHLDG